MPPVYLDSNATTPADPRVLQAVCEASLNAGANPGSPHAEGRAARRVLEDSRELIAGLLDADPGELIFTSGGTESINLAVRGLCSGRPGNIALTAGEHPAVRESCLAMQSAGCQLTTLDVDGQGRLRTETLPQAIGSDTILACLLLAHNETGVIQDIRQLTSHCREQQVPLLLDAVPAVGRIPVSFRETGAAALAFGAHKFHGPRGIGGLLLREDIQIPSMLRGGHQERGRRAGTEPVPLIAGMAEAMRLAISEMEHRTAHLKALRDRLQEGLQAASAPVVIHGQQAQRLPNTLSIGFPGVPGDALLVNLHMEGVSCSLGSACASGSAEPAPALLAMGIAPDLCRSSVRFSLNYQNTAEEIERVIPIVARIVSQLREAQSF